MEKLGGELGARFVEAISPVTATLDSELRPAFLGCALAAAVGALYAALGPDRGDALMDELKALGREACAEKMRKAH